MSQKVAVAAIVMRQTTTGIEVLLMKQNREKKWYHEMWGPPGGKIEANETIHQAVLRELREETGLVANTASLIGVSCFHAEGHQYIVPLLAVTKFEGEPMNTEPDKVSEIKWFAVNALPDQVVPSVREAFSLGTPAR